jgi:hypothetical protein
MSPHRNVSTYIYKAAESYFREDSNLHNHRRESLKSLSNYVLLTFLCKRKCTYPCTGNCSVPAQLPSYNIISRRGMEEEGRGRILTNKFAHLPSLIFTRKRGEKQIMRGCVSPAYTLVHTRCARA